MLHSLFDSAILGIVEGLTEFIPVSSTGHLIIVEAFLRRNEPSAGVFDVVIQIGAILAVVWARRERILRMAHGFFTGKDKAERLMAIKIIVAFMPAVFIGLALHDFIKSVLFSPWIVAVSLIVGGIIMLIAEKTAPEARVTNMDDISIRKALEIGFCQCLAIIPGVSRSGASIVGARFLGVERRAATEFSFFLAIPTLFGAAALDLLKNIHFLSASDLPIFTVGTVMAFISAFLVVNRLIDFVGKHGFAPFGWYRIGLGLVVIVLLCCGYL